MSSAVSRPSAADSARALKHFESLLEFETDCWDVHHAITINRMDFVLLALSVVKDFIAVLALVWTAVLASGNSEAARSRKSEFSNCSI